MVAKVTKGCKGVKAQGLKFGHITRLCFHDAKAVLMSIYMTYAKFTYQGLGKSNPFLPKSAIFLTANADGRAVSFTLPE